MVQLRGRKRASSNARWNRVRTMNRGSTRRRRGDGERKSGVRWDGTHQAGHRGMTPGEGPPRPVRLADVRMVEVNDGEFGAGGPFLRLEEPIEVGMIRGQTPRRAQESLRRGRGEGGRGARHFFGGMHMHNIDMCDDGCKYFEEWAREGGREVVTKHHPGGKWKPDIETHFVPVEPAVILVRARPDEPLEVPVVVQVRMARRGRDLFFRRPEGGERGRRDTQRTDGRTDGRARMPRMMGGRRSPIGAEAWSGVRASNREGERGGGGEI
jgi:hypothetical protein